MGYTVKQPWHGEGTDRLGHGLQPRARALCQSAKLQHIAVEQLGFPNVLRWLGEPSTGISLGALIIKLARPHPKDCPLGTTIEGGHRGYVVVVGPMSHRSYTDDSVAL
jgi:hypothetical protein